MKVPFFNYKFVYSQHKKKIDKSIQRVLNSGSFILQKENLTFEKNLAKFINAKYVIGVADGTNAIALCLKASGIKKGDEVIMSSHTYIATASAVHDCGGIPVLIDCKEDLMMDENKIEKAITKKTKFILPTQLNGRVCNMDKILMVAKKYNLKVIEDSAQGLGAKFKKKFSGTFGIAGTISFYPAKILGCFGDGGAVVTNDTNIAKRIYLLRDHGRNKDGKVIAWGHNCRLDNLQASILNTKLKYLDKDLKLRRKLANLYHKYLCKNKNLVLPPKPSNSDHYDVYQNFEIQADKRNLLKRYLKKKGIGTIVQWNGQALHMMQNLKMRKTNLNYTNNIFKKILLLPMNCSLKEKDIKFICREINSFYAKQ